MRAALYSSKLPTTWSPAGFFGLGPLLTACIGLIGPNVVRRSTVTVAVAAGSAARAAHMSEAASRSPSECLNRMSIAFPPSFVQRISNATPGALTSTVSGRDQTVRSPSVTLS